MTDQQANLMRSLLCAQIHKNGGCMPYSDEGVAIMNIQFDLIFEEVFGYVPNHQ